MPKSYNIYCDESCHLEHSKCDAMILGGIYCKTNDYKIFVKGINEIKEKHNIPIRREIKWTKISPSKLSYYLDLVDYFFNTTGLFFRGVVIPNKKLLNHNEYSQTHEDWYWKMYYEMLKIIFQNTNTYKIFIDIKDTHSYKKSKSLESFLSNTKKDFDGDIISSLQVIRSHESTLMQLADMFLGALSYIHNEIYESEGASTAKVKIIDRIKERTTFTLKKTTYLSDKKFNLLIWRSNSSE